ncbi:asparagine synthase (glutamine-hydrolyzing) [Aliarcobacter butzleri]|uniref:asparagine synthase (glutamine-hydrolyzing) n=1 Tax=Aliarcobacter butzleri TaxID=28197 RepID=UPI002B244DCC|nr:asparagine synthase (glutamine-hydrolyzing) [Aliarcobacter butzleri]
MCGITGIIKKELNQKNDIKKMTEIIKHRGPDGYGYYYGENFVFGHRRLSIVDLSSAGHQPMKYLEKYVITFNGEIYNYLELRKTLEELGYKFKTDTDTEVIMASYDYWGKDCLNKFNGMWSFVIYNSENKVFFISRDRFGKKPLFFYKIDDSFIFASEIKSILQNSEVLIKKNKVFLQNYINTICKEYTKETAFENIYRFEPASYFEGTIDDLICNFNQKKFWRITPNLSNEKFDEVKAKEFSQKYYELLEDAVRIRLRADVKVGSALSGGLDSSSIVFLVNKLLREEKKEELQETFSSVYKSKGTEECDESVFINIMADKLKVNSNQIEPVEEDIPNEYEKMIWHLENPPQNSLMSSWHTYKLVSTTKIKVTLDGQGADEQLAGYLPYLLNYISSLSFIDMMNESRKCFFIPNAKKYVLIGLIMGLYRIFLGPKFLKYTLKKVFKKEFSTNLNEQLVKDINENLVTLLHFADRTSMAFSIESRMPFLDYRLVEFLASIPSCYKMRNGWTKYIARLAFDGKLPDEVNWRQDKMGWPIPEKKWFTGLLKEWFKKNIDECNICKDLKIKSPSNFAQQVKLVNLSIMEKLFWKN